MVWANDRYWLSLLKKAGLQHKIPCIHFAVHFVPIGSIAQPYTFYLGAFFQHRRRAFDLQVFNQNHRIPICQGIAIGIPYYAIAFLSVLCRRIDWPFMRAICADVIVAILIGVFHRADGAGRDMGHKRLSGTGFKLIDLKNKTGLPVGSRKLHRFCIATPDDIMS